MSRGWIRFRNYLRREEVGQDITLRFVDSLVFTPAPLETILRAEEAIRANLQAGWTLQTSGIVRALHTHTFPGRNFNSHIGAQ
jgi:hypothetical protein